jgi:hypothetical protein
MIRIVLYKNRKISEYKALLVWASKLSFGWWTFVSDEESHLPRLLLRLWYRQRHHKMDRMEFLRTMPNQSCYSNTIQVYHPIGFTEYVLYWLHMARSSVFVFSTQLKNVIWRGRGDNFCTLKCRTALTTRMTTIITTRQVPSIIDFTNSLTNAIRDMPNFWIEHRPEAMIIVPNRPPMPSFSMYRDILVALNSLDHWAHMVRNGPESLQVLLEIRTLPRNYKCCTNIKP